jgi:hypothetical protein
MRAWALAIGRFLALGIGLYLVSRGLWTQSPFDISHNLDTILACFLIWAVAVVALGRLIYGSYGRPPRDRFGVILMGYVLAVATAVLTMAAGFFFVHLMGLGTKPLSVTEAQAAAMIIAMFSFMYMPALTALPAIIFITRAEIAGVRAAAAYSVGGAVTGLLVFACAWAFSTVMTGHSATTPTNELLGNIALVALIPGACGGLAYWALAGRWAGSGIIRPSVAASG